MRSDLEPSPPLVRAAYRGSMEHMTILQQEAAENEIPTNGLKLQIRHANVPTDRRSLNENEEREWRRHTFCAISQLDENEQEPVRQTYYGMRSPLPPKSVGSMTLQPRCNDKTHIEHMRVYGKALVLENEKLPLPMTQEGEAFVDVVSPGKSTVWTRGKPVTIEWKVLDSKVEFVRIELFEEGSTATTVVAKETANSGSFTYSKVPWGMASGDKYFLRVTSTADPSRHMTTSCFRIGTAP